MLYLLQYILHSIFQYNNYEVDHDAFLSVKYFLYSGRLILTHVGYDVSIEVARVDNLVTDRRRTVTA